MEIKWEVAIPHRGGFLLELLDENEKVIQQLWNGLGPDNKYTEPRSWLQ